LFLRNCNRKNNFFAKEQEAKEKKKAKKREKSKQKQHLKKKAQKVKKNFSYLLPVPVFKGTLSRKKCVRIAYGGTV
jgi:hypothetical protein